MWMAASRHTMCDECTAWTQTCLMNVLLGRKHVCERTTVEHDSAFDVYKKEQNRYSS